MNVTRIVVAAVAACSVTQGCRSAARWTDRSSHPTPPLLGASSPQFAPDTSLFEALIRSLPRQPYHLLQVDPRPLRADPAIQLPHRNELADVPASVPEFNRSVLPRLGALELDAYADAHCESGAGSLGRVPDSGPVASPSGEPRPFCVVVGLPRAGGAYFPPGGIDQRAAAPHEAVVSRVVVITPSNQTGYDVVAVPIPAGGWRVIDRVQLWRSWS